MSHLLVQTLATVVLFIVAVMALSAVILAVVRFFKLRSSGAQVLVRKFPAKDTHGWRHGIVRYSPEYLEYFKLRSVSPAADLRLHRLDVEVLGARTLDDEEAAFMPEATEAVHLRCPDGEFELAADVRTAMALQAWVESAPSRRKENFNFKALHDKLGRTGNQY